MDAFNFTSANHEENVEKAIDACRMLIKTLSNPNLQPLEREAGYILAKALRVQVKSLGLLDAPEVQEFLELQEETRPTKPVMRYPQDFDEALNLVYARSS